MLCLPLRIKSHDQQIAVHCHDKILSELLRSMDTATGHSAGPLCDLTC